jgi:hypothetical protein
VQEQYLTSVRHKPLSNIKCVANVKCKKQFNCLLTQLHYLEAGRCISGMTKTKLNTVIAANNTGTDHNIRRSHGTVAARGQPVCDFDIADSESDTHLNLDRIPRLLSTLPHTHIHSLN